MCPKQSLQLQGEGRWRLDHLAWEELVFRAYMRHERHLDVLWLQYTCIPPQQGSHRPFNT